VKAKVLCCGEGCGKFLGWTDTSDGKPSHGLCPDCYKIEMQKVDDYYRRDEASQEEPAGVTPLGPQEPPSDPMIYNRRQADGTFRPLAGFWERDDAPLAGE